MSFVNAFEELHTLMDTYVDSNPDILHPNNWRKVQQDPRTRYTKALIQGVLEMGEEVLYAIAQDLINKYAGTHELDISRPFPVVTFRCGNARHPQEVSPVIAKTLLDIELLSEVPELQISPLDLRYIPPISATPTFTGQDVLRQGVIHCPYCETPARTATHATDVILIFDKLPRVYQLIRQLGKGEGRSIERDLEALRHTRSHYGIQHNIQQETFTLEQLLGTKLSPKAQKLILDSLSAPDLIIEMGVKTHSLMKKFFETTYINPERDVHDILRMRFISQFPEAMLRQVQAQGYLLQQAVEVKNEDSGYQAIHLNTALHGGRTPTSERLPKEFRRIFGKKCFEGQFRTFEQDQAAETDPEQMHGNYKVKLDRERRELFARFPDMQLETRYEFLKRVASCSEIAGHRIIHW